nr:hypothetical protein [Neobacillus sp. Marseille-Q6967]
MSVVIGYVNDQFSILMTDTRISYGMYAEFGWEDHYEKLVSIPSMGWATGVGVYEFIERFLEKLEKSGICTNRKIENLYVHTLEKEKHKNECIQNHIDSTVITCSWISVEENSKKFKVGLLSKEHFGHSLVELAKDRINILYPFDYIQDYQRVEKLEKRYSLKNSYNGKLDMILEKLLKIFSEIAENSTGVSQTCHIGIHLFRDHTVCKLNLREDIRSLLKASKNGTIVNRFLVENE